MKRERFVSNATFLHQLCLVLFYAHIETRAHTQTHTYETHTRTHTSFGGGFKLFCHSSMGLIRMHPCRMQALHAPGCLPKPHVCVQGSPSNNPSRMVGLKSSILRSPHITHDKCYRCSGITQPFEKSQPRYLSPLTPMAALLWINRVLKAELHDVPRQPASEGRHLSGD